MNCNQANQIPLDTIIKAMGYKALAKHSGGQEQWYENPLRTERTPSFSVNHKKNLWQDLGTGQGGKVIDLVMQYSSTNVSGALQWLKENLNSTKIPQSKTTHSARIYEEKKSRFEINKVKRVMNPNLIAYGKERGINSVIIDKHLKETHYTDTETGKTFYGLGIQNQSGGYAVRNKYMKTAIAPNDFTYIEGTGARSNTVNVFEVFFDYLSHLMITQQQEPENKTIILNSTAMAKRAADFLRDSTTIDNVVLFLDNEKEGSKAAEAVERATDYFTALPYAVYIANDTYVGYEDLNACYQATGQAFQIEMRPIKPHDHDLDTGLQM
ncbi:toprim domain-containing protein [Aquimarina sp. I32.4]|uniref:toprim domain-containing protein n=1 Tax=Aquimarina sp. I32.4 TaxID=2053903 RepID=UPI000CDE5F61|nr:toprim domain-containing protein [Aquimarina sp. I32.4]